MRLPKNFPWMLAISLFIPSYLFAQEAPSPDSELLPKIESPSYVRYFEDNSYKDAADLITEIKTVSNWWRYLFMVPPSSGDKPLPENYSWNEAKVLAETKGFAAVAMSISSYDDGYACHVCICLSRNPDDKRLRITDFIIRRPAFGGATAGFAMIYPEIPSSPQLVISTYSGGRRSGHTNHEIFRIGDRYGDKVWMPTLKFVTQYDQRGLSEEATVSVSGENLLIEIQRETDAELKKKVITLIWDSAKQVFPDTPLRGQLILMPKE